ncbi:helix-turn-helix transcriptional regulator [Flavobacterium anhuiense]|uniref:helix-turn-helix transcriptional regulator n=1 Tax=Flavobacterium anhuiense TaxID=459526 RepID=UPI00197ADCE3|nr:helix-turn-helix transcriptional regulator [Flavobacterium anhuiense]
MNELNIKELRIQNGFSQTELAKKIGVSRQTIVNYEKGEVIPESKKELLYNILHNENSKTTPEIEEYYTKPKSGYDKKIQEKEEEIKARLETVKLLREKKLDPKHELTIISILRTQIEIIKEATENHKNE